ncbi:MAG: hypothetical protein IT537_00015 [Hyphomicrobiales bacterium]|nr:hypothetical protein [Hyphomicrobiales bacterium]
MDDKLIYVKTNIGEEMVAERTRLVQRNLRMVLIMVDGTATVADLRRQAGDAGMVDASLDELERLGLVETIEARERRVKRREAAMASSSRFTFEQGAPGEPRVEPQAARADRTLTGWEALEGGATVACGMPDFFDDGASRKPAEPDSPQRVDEPPARVRRSFVEMARQALAEWRKRKQAQKEERAFRLAYERATEADTIVPVKLKRVKRGPRLVIAWPLAMLLALFALALLIVLSAVLFPYQRYRPEMEQALATLLQDEVSIRGVHFSFLPYPNVTLETVSIGADPYATAQTVRVIPDLSWLHGERRLLRDVRIESLRLRGPGMAAAARWLDAPGVAKSGIVVRALRVDDLVVEVGDTALVDLQGEAVLHESGALDKVLVHNGERSLRIEATPADGGYDVAVIAAEWRSPFRPRFQFSYLDARGKITPGRLVLSRIQGRLYDGTIEGAAALDWSRGVALAGEVSVRRVSSAKLFAALDPSLSLEGDISGRLRLRSQAKSFADVLGTLRVDGDFAVTRGVINHFDLVEAVRGGNRGQTRGGATRFERMTGSVRGDERAYRITRLNISSGLMHASGVFDVDRNQTLGGLLDVSLSGSASAFRGQVRIAGTLADPQLLSLAINPGVRPALLAERRP